MSVDDDCRALDAQMLGARRERLLRRVLTELREIGRLGVPLALSSASGNLNGLVTGRWEVYLGTLGWWFLRQDMGKGEKLVYVTNI